MNKMSYSKIYKKSVGKANAMSCPNCQSEGPLKYVNIQLVR